MARGPAATRNVTFPSASRDITRAVSRMRGAFSGAQGVAGRLGGTSRRDPFDLERFSRATLSDGNFIQRFNYAGARTTRRELSVPRGGNASGCSVKTLIRSIVAADRSFVKYPSMLINLSVGSNALRMRDELPRWTRLSRDTLYNTCTRDKLPRRDATSRTPVSTLQNPLPGAALCAGSTHVRSIDVENATATRARGPPRIERSIRSSTEKLIYRRMQMRPRAK